MTLERRNGEHWDGLLYMRKLSIYVTWALAKTPITPNQVTGLMIVTGVEASLMLLLPGLAAASWPPHWCRSTCCSTAPTASSPGGPAAPRPPGSTSTRWATTSPRPRSSSAWASRTPPRCGPAWYTVLGFAAALGAILIKAETDLVDVARGQSGLVAATEVSGTQFQSRKLAMARRAATARCGSTG